MPSLSGLARPPETGLANGSRIGGPAFQKRMSDDQGSAGCDNLRDKSHTACQRLLHDRRFPEHRVGGPCTSSRWIDRQLLFPGLYRRRGDSRPRSVEGGLAGAYLPHVWRIVHYGPRKDQCVRSRQNCCRSVASARLPAGSEGSVESGRSAPCRPPMRAVCPRPLDSAQMRTGTRPPAGPAPAPPRGGADHGVPRSKRPAEGWMSMDELRLEGVHDDGEHIWVGGDTTTVIEGTVTL